MKNILTIVKKELSRIFKDPKLIIVVLLMPGILIYGLYSIMGSAMNSGNDAGTGPLKVYTINMPDEGSDFRKELEKIDADYNGISSGELNEYKTKLENKEIDMILEFSGIGAQPDVNIYYNHTAAKSEDGYKKVSDALSALQTTSFEIKAESIADEKVATGQIFAMMVPVVLISLLFSGCMAVAPDSIAGEKERGTMATLLKTPVKRRNIAIGKISALSILAIISAVSSFIGLMLSMPKLTGLSGASGIYGFSDYAFILLIIVSTVLIIISVMSVLSSFSKTVKEANMLIMPFMMLSMLVGITSMISSMSASEFYFYLIPLYNSVQCLASILTFSINPVNLIVTLVSNFVYVGILIFVLSKLFNNEKIMFAK